MAKATFKPFQLINRSVDGIYTLLIVTLVFSLATNIWALIELFLFYGDKQWDDGTGLNIALGQLAFFIMNTVLIFHRRKEDEFIWLATHIRRAWSITKWSWIIFFVLLLSVITLSILQSEAGWSDADIDAFLEPYIAFCVVLIGIIFIPWASLALLKLNDDNQVVK